MLDPYGAEAAALLADAAPLVDAVARSFVEQFYGELARVPEMAAILNSLTSPAMQRLQSAQAEHLRFLLRPETTRRAVTEAASRLGEIHALVGIETAAMVQSHGLYRRLLEVYLDLSPMPIDARYRLLRVMYGRLGDDLSSQLQQMEVTQSVYRQLVLRPLPPAGTPWAGAERALIAALAGLPGVLGAAIQVPDAHGVFQVVGASGPARPVPAATEQAAQQLAPDTAPAEQKLLGRVWNQRQILTVLPRAQDPVLAALGARSAVAIPLLDSQGHPVAVLSLRGAWVHQFESPWMREFTWNLQHYLGELWARCSTPEPGQLLPPQLGQRYRERLFAGGLSMYVQPLVDLRSGQVTKVEALARLSLPGGELVLPGTFLPLLGTAELDQLFLRGLEQALHALHSWDALGLDLQVSVNLPPSTLLNAGCTEWVGFALRQRAVAPERLTLELLESQALDSALQRGTLQRLHRLGVRLVIDDLGSGYANFKHLTALPFNAIKVGQDLLQQIHSAPLETLNLLSTLMILGRNYGLGTVIEGLETLGSIEVAVHLDAEYGQGYGLARPMPPGEFPAWLAEFRPPAREIRTPLGALTVIWRQLLRDRMDSDPTPLERCPVTGFFAHHGWAESAPARWHARFHAGTSAAEERQELLQWLVAQVKAPAPSGGGG